MSEIELPEPHAWVIASSLQWIADPARTPRAYTYVEMTRHDVEDCERAPIFTAEQVRQLLAAEREANALKCDAEVARLTEQGEPRAAIVAGICAAAIRGG